MSTSEEIRQILAKADEPMKPGAIVDALGCETPAERQRVYRLLSAMVSTKKGIEKLDDGRYALPPGHPLKRVAVKADPEPADPIPTVADVHNDLARAREIEDRIEAATSGQRKAEAVDHVVLSLNKRFKRDVDPARPAPPAITDAEFASARAAIMNDLAGKVLIRRDTVAALVDIILEAGVPLGDEGRGVLREAIQVTA